MFNPMETPWLFLIIGIIILAAGSLVRNTVSPQKGLLLILVGLLISVAAFGVDYAFRTDYEQLRGLINTCRKAAVRNNIRLLEPCIASQYRDSVHQRKLEIVSDAERILKMAGISKIRFQSITFQFSGVSARAAVKASVFLDPQKSAFASGGLFFVEMSVIFEKQNNSRWLVVSSEIESINNQRMGWNSVY